MDNQENSTEPTNDVIEKNNLILERIAESHENMTDSLEQLSLALQQSTPKNAVLKTAKAEQATIESEAYLASMNSNINNMLKIINAEYALQKSIEDRDRRSSAEGKAKLAAKPKPKVEASTMKDAVKFNPAKSLSDWLTRNGGILGAGLVGVGKVLGKSLKMIRNVGRLPFKILGKVLSFGTKFTAGAVEKLGLSKLFGSIFSKVGRFLTRGMLSIFGKNFTMAFRGIFKGIMPLLESSISKILPRLLTSLNIVGDIVTLLSFVWKYIRGALFEWTKNSPILRGIVKTMDNVIMPVSNFFDHLGDLVLGAFTLNPAKIRQSILDMFGDITSLAGGVVNGILDGISAFGKIFSRLGKAIWAAVKDWNGNPLQTFNNVLLGAGSTNTTKIAATSGGIYSNAGDLMGQLTTTVKDVVSNVVYAAEGGINLLTGKAAELEKSEYTHLQKQGYNTKQISAIMGNLKAESGFRHMEENLTPTMASKRATSQKISLEDAYKYRGRGFIQLTGKGNYAAASKDIFGDDRLVKNPELAATPEVAQLTTDWYLNKIKKGGAVAREGLAEGDAAKIGAAINRGIATKMQSAQYGAAERLAYAKDYEKKLSSTKQSTANVTSIQSVTAVKQPSAAVPLMSAIKPAKDDKLIEKQQLSHLASISTNTSSNLSNFGLDTLPHSDNLLNANIGRGV